MVKLEQKHLSANNHGEIRAKIVSTIVVKYFDQLSLTKFTDQQNHKNVLV